jgi:hypothetical protein
MSVRSADVQYRVVFGKKDEVVEGPDDATLVISVGVLDARDDPAEAFMRGALKATGPSGRLFEVLRTGEAAGVLSRLASRP